MVETSRAVVTGGAGFVGSNYSRHLLQEGFEVVVYDDFSRGPGCRQNVNWLRSHPNSKKLSVIEGNVRDSRSLTEAAEGCNLIVHTAAQVSVPQSVSTPRLDFESNALGTFNVIEVARQLEPSPKVIYTSSNKVYGVPNVRLTEHPTKYDFIGLPKGVDESFPLSSEEPYGASKASGDLYLQSHARQYGIRSVSFRCSCMYGPRQWGKEEQGWVGWFCIAAARQLPLNIFGDGKQVRDLLYIDDVVRAFDAAIKNIDRARGEAINLGGGATNAVSLHETISFLETVTGRKINLEHRDWRPGDNKCYYTNCEKAKKLLNWEPIVGWKEGVKRTLEWVQTEYRELSPVPSI